MSHPATLRNYRFQDSSAEIRGGALYAENGKGLARIHDIIFDHENGDIQYLVAAYGRERKVMVALDRVQSTDDGTLYSRLTPDDLDYLPAFDDRVLNENQWYAYQQLYRSAMRDRDCLHELRRNNVTSIDRGRRWKGPTRTEQMQVASIQLGSRWQRFQDEVRRDLSNVRQSCATCRKRRRIA